MPYGNYYNYRDTGNTLQISETPLYPFSNHLLWEHATYGLFFVRHDDQTKLVKTADEGATDCVNIDLTGATSKKIQAGWLDGNDLWLVCCDNPDDEFTVIYVELDNSDNVVDVGDSSGADAGTLSAKDIFKVNNNHYVINFEDRTGTTTLVVWDVDEAPFVEVDTYTTYAFVDIYKGVTHLATNYYTIAKTATPTLHRITFAGGSIGADGTGFAAYTVPDDLSQMGVAFDGTNFLYFIAEKVADEADYLIAYSLSGNSYSALSQMNVSLMLDRNVRGTTPPFTLERGYDLANDLIYQIPAIYTGKLNLISVFNFDDAIKGITDHYIIDASGNLYETMDLIALGYIPRAEIRQWRQDYAELRLSYNANYLTINPQMVLQIIGSYTVGGSTSNNVVIFEGIAEKPTYGILAYALIKNQGKEMDEVKPIGEKSGRTDEVITDVNNDGAPNGPSYIHDGTLSEGEALGTVLLEGQKLRKLYDRYAELDGFTWYLRNQGALDYNNGAVDSGADIRFDGTTYTDTILHLEAWKQAKYNQIIVNGAINLLTGISYTGKWDDTADQFVNGINSITIEDANLDSDAKCQTKADNLGALEETVILAKFKYRKTTYGWIQPGQTITFLFDMTNYIVISSAQFIVDYNMFEVISGSGYMQIRS